VGLKWGCTSPISYHLIEEFTLHLKEFVRTIQSVLHGTQRHKLGPASESEM